MGDTLGTGFLFTRNPSTGENKLYGEFLINAQDILDQDSEDLLYIPGVMTPTEVSVWDCLTAYFKENACVWAIIEVGGSTVCTFPCVYRTEASVIQRCL
ncbi:pyruvate, phosphate dikinase, chloroplastic [Artemisia annua]|uniref:Pyruvate, phosphate dikinase, chloroplastic n=1 Tax=Artemisia annua TaxID=35608 RepID=A0A2U1LV18_ARTAN|nr:pyruvate, phosphate dikinase, chloroplastic [Artemisia annua]